VRACVGTVCKLLGNLTGSGGGEKFRCIRMANAAISSKVLDVPGGLQLLLAAGFVQREGEEAAGLLQHAYDSESAAAARYVLDKLLLLQ